MEKIDSIWVLVIMVAKVIGGLVLLDAPLVETVFGQVPALQILGAALIADVLVATWRLQRVSK